MSSISTTRINSINRLRCSIFQTSYNPTSVRTGAKYLRARLRGPSMVKYYPKVPNLSQLIKQNLEIGWTNEEAKVRLQDIEDRKARGKGAPKKAKSEGIFSSPLWHCKKWILTCCGLQMTVGGRTGRARSARAHNTRTAMYYNESINRSPPYQQDR
jgi:small subunit ribosomal protein S33